MTIGVARPRYLTKAETAKIIRSTLKQRYPGIKFSIRSKGYSGGASIDVSWSDGPRREEIEAITDGFEGSSFDGMNDLKSPQKSWLMPDGTAQLASRPESYGGSIPGYVSDAPLNAELVSFRVDFVFCSRDISDFDRRKIEALAYIRQHCRCDGDPPIDRFGNEWVDSLARRMVQDHGMSETIEQTFERIVLRR